MACYTPRIPDEDRPDLKATASNLVFQVSLEIINEELNSKSQINCANLTNCRVSYNTNYTAEMIAYNPKHFYPGSILSFWMKPRNNNIQNLISIKIGQSICATEVLEDNNYNWNSMYITCNTGKEISSGAVGGYLVDYSYGIPSRNSLFENYEVDPTIKPNLYYFKVFPIIDSISENSGTSQGGQIITINGKGFSIENTKVYINSDECVNELTVTVHQITCKLPETSFTYDSNLFFLGSQGLRRRIYNLPNGNISSLKSLSGFPEDSINLISDEVYLETQTLPLNISNYGQYFNGYFKAIYTGKYRFWSASDDASQLYLSTDMTATNLVDIINFNSWVGYFDYFTQSYRTRSKWIDLVKDNYYYMEIYHVQGLGAEHYQLGVEIQSKEIPVDSPNIIKKFGNYHISVKFSRDLYSIVVNTLNNNEYKMTCRMTDDTFKFFNIDPNSSAQTFRNQLVNILGDSKLIVRKVGYNDSMKYFLAEGEIFDDSSYTSSYNFSDMYLNISGEVSLESIPLETVSTGTKTGVVFLVFFDTRASERTYKIENNCYLSSSTAQFIDITKLQSVSPEMSGTFSLKVINNKNPNQFYVTPDIDITTFNSDIMLNVLNDIPLLTDEINLWYSKSAIEEIIFNVRYSNYADVSVTVNTNKLLGGIDDKPTINIQSISEDLGNLFFMPITPEFLYVKSKIIFLNFSI
jgi:hypothetical protein